MPTSITNPTVPTVGGSSGTWGTTLNTAVGTLYTNDSNLKATADAALPLAGGTMTGNVDLTTATMATTAKGSVSGAVTLDLSASDHFSLTVGGAITGITLSNVPASPKVAVLILEITNGGAFAITWPTSFKFPSGTAPALTISGVDVVGFLTRNGGTSWLMVGVQKNLA